MIRILLRALAMLALAGTVVLAVIDATRSIAASAWTFTSLAESWQTVSAQGFESVKQSTIQTAGAGTWDHFIAPVLGLPAWGLLAALALLLYICSHVGRRRHGYFADARNG